MAQRKHDEARLASWLAQARRGVIELVCDNPHAAASLRNGLYYLQRGDGAHGLHGLRHPRAIRIERSGRKLTLRPTRSGSATTHRVFELTQEERRS